MGCYLSPEIMPVIIKIQKASAGKDVKLTYSDFECIN